MSDFFSISNKFEFKFSISVEELALSSFNFSEFVKLPITPILIDTKAIITAVSKIAISPIIKLFYYNTISK